MPVVKKPRGARLFDGRALILFRAPPVPREASSNDENARQGDDGTARNAFVERPGGEPRAEGETSG